MLNNFTSYQCAGNNPSYGATGGANYYPMPYADYTSTAVPRSFSELLDWSEYLYTVGDVRELFKRMFSYFITDLDFKAIDPEKSALTLRDETNWKHMMVHDIQWPEHCMYMFDNVAAYGNDLFSVMSPIQRYLSCPHCGRTQGLVQVSEADGSEFAHRQGKFVGRCQSPSCKKNHPGITEFQPLDIRSKDPADFTIKHWPVREIVLEYYPWTDETHTFWKIPESYKKQVKEGDVHTLATADLGVLDAIDKNQLFKFKKDRVFHAKEFSLSGLHTRGWGLPRTLYLTRQAWTLQMIRKQVQALGIDFVTPMRIVSPSTQPVNLGNGMSISPNTTVNHADFQRQMNRIRASHRRDPTQIHSMQMPVDYKVLGGEANQLFPRELHLQAKEDLLDAGGFPAQIYKMDLTTQTAPVGLRLFEASNKQIPMLASRAAQFTADRVAELSEKDKVRCEHKRVSIVDNIENAIAKLQLATSGQLSMGEALEPMGIDPEQDMTRQIDEQKMRTRMSRKMEEELAKEDDGLTQMQMAQPITPPAGAVGSEADMMAQEQAAGAQGGAPAGPGGAPAGPGGMPGGPQLPSQGFQFPQDLEGLQMASEALAQTLASLGPGTPQRSQELAILRETNPTAHSLVTSLLPQADASFAREAAMQMQMQPPM
jgi:hypothetical protein